MISKRFIWKSIIWRLSSWKTFKSLLNKLYTSKVIVQDVPKRNVLLELPLFKSTLFQNQKTLQKLFIDNLKFKNRFYVTCYS